MMNYLAGKCLFPAPNGHHHETSINVFSVLGAFWHCPNQLGQMLVSWCCPFGAIRFIIIDRLMPVDTPLFSLDSTFNYGDIRSMFMPRKRSMQLIKWAVTDVTDVPEGRRGGGGGGVGEGLCKRSKGRRQICHFRIVEMSQGHLVQA